MKMKLLLSVFALSAGIQLHAQQLTKRLDSLFSIKQPVPYLNGGILVSDQHQLVFHQGFGLANDRTGLAIDKNARFQTASLSKTITSTAVLQLVDQQKIKLSDPFSDYFKDFPYPTITIRHLLNHTSGLPDQDLFKTMIDLNRDTIVRNSDVMTLLINQNKQLLFEPGDSFRYSNVGYQLLALLVEKISKMDFSSYLNKYVFRPAGMKDSYVRLVNDRFEDPLLVKNMMVYPMYFNHPQDVDSLVANDTLFRKRFQNDIVNQGWTFGDQNVISSTYDLYLFTEAFLSGKLISKQLVKEALKPTVLNDGVVFQEENPLFGGKASYGLGWEVSVSSSAETIIGHSGYNRGIQCNLICNVSQVQVLVMFDNIEGYDFVEKQLNILQILKNKPAESIDLRISLVRTFGNDLVNRSRAEALLHFTKMMEDSVNFRFSKKEMNQLGYTFLQNGHLDLALEVFELNLLLHPTDFNLYDSYGDGLIRSLKNDDAKLAFTRALELNPDCDYCQKKLNDLQELNHNE